MHKNNLPNKHITKEPTHIMSAQPAPIAQAPTQRDPRLDFYRGIAMLIIFTSHTPGNFWGDWIPGRFGFSDATEIFVFCSGMASAVAFGRSYDNRGWFLGTARVCFRVWQIYWAHIALFFFCVMMLASWDLYGDFEKNYINGLNLGRFLSDTAPLMVGLFTLTYVPNFFDILPMYIGILLMMPFIMLAAKVDTWLAFALSITLWILAQSRILDALDLSLINISLPAEPWSERPWFFNPFGWQLIFFTGFAFMRGWLPAPPVSRRLVWICIGFLLLSAPFGSWKVVDSPWLGTLSSISIQGSCKVGENSTM